MTTLMISAIISLLLAFGVDIKTVDDIRVIITPVEASTTPITTVQTVITPIVENAPVYFGSTNPTVDNPTPSEEPVVVLPPMDTTAPKLEAIEIVPQENEYYLRLWSNELLDFSKTTFPEGITISQTITDGKSNGTSRKLGALYLYEAKLAGIVTDYVSVTIQDIAGNTLTSNVHTLGR